MASNQERLFQTSRNILIIEDYLVEHVVQSVPIDESGLMKVVKYLDLIVDDIRSVNGASE
jgi:hypothetical protein